MSQEIIAPLSVVIDEVNHLFARAKTFKSGSVGWYASEKMVLGGERCQVSVCVTVIGSGKKGKVESDKREEVQGNEERARTVKEATKLEDGSELLEVIPEPQTEPYASRRPSWKKTK